MRSHRNALNPIFNLGELPAVPNPSIPPPRSRTLFPQRAVAVRIPAAQPHPLLHLPGEGKRGRGEAGMFRRDIRVSDAKRGRVPCRSKEHTASTRPTQPNHHIQPKIKSLLPWGRRLLERLTGWKAEIPSARGNVFPPGSDSRFRRGKSPATKSGAFGAADGNRTRVSGLGSVRSTIELQPHLFQCIAPACRG